MAISDDTKAARRDAACIEACRGISTEALERVAALPPGERPAALAEAARRQAAKIGAR
jgi:hypothetical protein